ncbi:gamma-glutamyltransferase family protein [Segnochrobactraceae bacterium EtOH-i3]
MTETAVGDGGMVVAPHSAAALAGAEILKAGGSAVDAMIAAAAAIAVVYPHMNHLGGDGFWLIAEPGDRPPRFIDASGRAGARATPAFYRDQEHDTIPRRGPLAALTAAGAVAGWDLAHRFAASIGGGLPLGDLLAPAIGFARDGIRVTRSQTALTREKFDELAGCPGFAATFLTDGKAPETGSRLAFPRLADTLDHLARTGLGDFYRGDVGAEIAADLERIGSPVTRADLERTVAEFRAPLSTRLSVGTVYNAPPPTQGLASLVILGLFDRLKVARAEGFEHVHGLVEATKRAFLLRDRVVTCPDRLPADPQSFLSGPWLDREVEKIDRRRAAPWPAPPSGGDTIWMGAIDRNGVAVSYIQSIFFEFGSGCVLPATGVLWQNRGASFSLDPKALNVLKPGAKPFHTLNPALARLDDGRLMVYGTMGGEGQPQTQAAVFTRHVLFREDLWKAIDAPRWLLGRTWGDETTALRLENRFDPGVIDRLDSAGHPVIVLDAGWSDTMGHAGAITRRADGRMEGAHDPRADGGAALA